MADASVAGGSMDDYPTIDPTSFDVVLCGTGLPESILAAACAAAGKTVLHVDPDPFYGSFYSSIPLPSVPSILSPNSSTPCPPSTTASSSATAAYTAVDLERRSLYSEVETSGTVPEPSRRFTVDLVGPRVLYCADEAVDLLLRSGGSHHVEFKSVEGGSLIYWDGALCPVPDSRQAIFMDSTHRSKEKLNLRDNLKEKTLLFRFFKLVQSHIAASSSGDKDGEGEASGKISEEDLDLPFIEFLKKQQLQPKIRAVVLYAIAMADYDQDAADSCEKLLTTRDGIKTLALYSSSIGRFANAQGAFIYPMYGHGELPQAFCRFAAVKALQEQQATAVRALQLSSNVAVCPPGMQIHCPVFHYQGTSGTVLSCPMPDENLDYRDILESTKQLFTDTYPDEEFLPRNAAPKYADDDSDLAE
ncbi:unnamed protein product [Triticum turgidum subsp. durum]|uniref:Rab proteins geranylgeranyltransferase component n=1 Tax=Triticum turgidum subsp. durum TaxID=4567 RepID=A0A9R0VKT2_TRITD|nr:unnamed protein product [Triticum turgidum subsp. durum]